MEAIEQAFMNISEQLGLQDATHPDMKSQVEAHLSYGIASSWLLIIDNAADMDIWLSSNSSSSVLKTFLPHSPHGFTIFTTRNQQLASKLVGPDIVSISEMDDKTAKHLLEVSLAQKELLEDDNSATILIYQLSGLPLALIQAASYINENLISLKTYLSILSEQESGTIELLSQDFEDEWRYEEMKNPIAITWLISFYQIQRLNSLAASYLSFMACINPRDIPQSLLPPTNSLTKQQNALGLLRVYAFITKQVDNRFISIHPLVHLATRNWLRSEGILGEHAAKAGKRLIEIFPSNAHENRKLWREYLPHGQFILESKEFKGETEEGELLAQKVGKCLDSDERYHEAEILFKETLEKRKRLNGNDPNTLISMANLALTYSNQGRWAEAEGLEMQVMETRKTVLGSKHPDTLASMANLALTYSNQGRWAEAETLFVHVIETRKTVLGKEHPDMLASMGKLASTYWDQERWAEAEMLFVQVMETGKKVLGPEHPDMLASMANLALTYSNQERWTEAERLEVQVMETRKTLLGLKHPDTLASMANLASTYWNQGRWAEAERVEVQVMETRKTVLGLEHPDTLASMGSLVSTYLNQKRWTDAERLQAQVMETRKKALGPEHPDTLACMGNLSHTLKKQGRDAAAIELLSTCVQLRRQILGPTHPHTRSAVADLANWQVQSRKQKCDIM
jgi:tetratricopeptide (TPR) repeat protein